jgi:putative ABC transport system permease protein
MNIMLVSVTERTREIGVRKALGARPFSILAQFVTEAVVLTLLGGAAGVALSYGTTWALGRALELPATVPGWAIGLALGSSTVVGLVAGIYPAARAARLDPIEALRYE